MISIVVPVYNVEKYLRECLESILKQTYQDIEVVMVDDGSTDSSGRICDEYAEKYENFKVVHKKNAGLGMARNTGLENISGEYVIFQDSDDFLEPGGVEALYNALVRNHVDLCKAGFSRVTEQGEKSYQVKYEFQLYPGEQAAKKFLPRLIGSTPGKHDSIEMCVWGAIYNAEIINQHGIRFPSERELISEDMIFNIEYLQYASGACIIEDVVCNYRVNQNSLTLSYRPDRFKAIKHFYQYVSERLTALGYGEDVQDRARTIFLVYIRMCISQEKSHCSRHSKVKSIGNIAAMCSDELVRSVIARYPAAQLEARQKAFVIMLKLRMAPLLYLAAELNLV